MRDRQQRLSAVLAAIELADAPHDTQGCLKVLVLAPRPRARSTPISQSRLRFRDCRDDQAKLIELGEMVRQPCHDTDRKPEAEVTASAILMTHQAP